MDKVLFITNIPAPYRVDFFKELGKSVELTVIFEARSAPGIRFNWNTDKYVNFRAIFLKEGDINEKKVNWSILKYINNDFDIIVVTNYAYYTEILAYIYLKLKRIPYALEVDGGIIRKEHNAIKMLKIFLISKAEKYLSPSKKTDEYLIYYGAKKSKICRYPFTSLKDKEILEEKLQFSDKKNIRRTLGIKENKVVLSIGQFIHRKGNDVLLKSARRIKKTIGFYIIGGEPTEEYIKLKEDYNLNNVHFLEFKSKKALKEYFKAADLFVLPTREDIWGLVINEAMSFGLPVITTDNCNAGLELIENNINGFIVPVGNDKILADKINYLLNNVELMNNISKNNLKKIRNYTIEKMARRHLEIFNEIINTRKNNF